MNSSASSLVTVIVPAYNYAEFIAEAINSALQQSHRNLEVVIVDDGSTDDTASVVNELVKQDTRVRYIHQHNQGLSAARNIGIKNATGEFVVFLDADDVMHGQKIQAHLEHFTRQPDTDISYGSSRYFLSGKPEENFENLDLNNAEWMPCVSGNGTSVMPPLVANNIMPVCSAMLRRAVLQRVGDFNTALKSLEDWEYWLRAAAVDCIFSYSNDGRLATYIRVHAISMSKNTLRMLQTQYRLRLDNIPHCLLQMKDQVIAKNLLRENRRRRLRCLTSIANMTGVCNREFIGLCRGESPVIVSRMLVRLLRSRDAQKSDD